MTVSLQVAFCCWTIPCRLSTYAHRRIICMWQQSKTSVPIIKELAQDGICTTSAFAWSLVLWHSMASWYAKRMTAQRCRQAAANGGIMFFGPRMVTNDWWSVSSVNCLPSIYTIFDGISWHQRYVLMPPSLALNSSTHYSECSWGKSNWTFLTIRILVRDSCSHTVGWMSVANFSGRDCSASAPS